MNDSTAIAHPLTGCPSCRREVPGGEFCGACGGLLAEGGGAGHNRRHAFAAQPGEDVLHLSVISTLLPHLPHRHAFPFRMALLGGAVLLVVLGMLDLTGPAVAAAALIVPLLYLLYLYEVEIYEDEPVVVIGATFAVGALLGVPFAIVAGPIVTQALIMGSALGPIAGDILVGGILIPLLAQLLMLAGALVLYVMRRFDEALDGFAFGAASALGFTFATTLVLLSPQLQQGFFSEIPPLTSALQIAQSGLLVPLIYASTTGLIAGALWLRRGHVRAHAARGWTTSLWVSVTVALGVQVGLGIVSVEVTNTAAAVLVYLVVGLLLMVWVRVAIHHMLLSEAVDVSIGPDAVCSHCHRLVPRMAFCPQCGIAARATPKRGAGRSGRGVR